MKKKIKYTFLILIALVGIGSVLLSKYVLPYSIIQPPRFTLDLTPEDLDLKSTDFAVLTKDSIEIKGYWIKTDSVQAKSTIILVHGIGGCKEHFLNLAKELAEIGVESVLIDCRAHGKSGGQYCTYGYKEKYDIASVVDYIKENNDSIHVGIWGNSMGGAIAIQALELDKRIEFGIIESTFTSLEDIVYDYQKNFAYGLGIKPMCDLALSEAGDLANFNPDSVSPIHSVLSIYQPVLIAHGEKDEKINFEYGKLLFENLASPHKTFISIKDGRHSDLREKGGIEYRNSIVDFIHKQILR